METPLDATFQPNVALQIRALQAVSSDPEAGWKQGAWLLGKQYGYASLSALDEAGALAEYCQQGGEAMRRQGYLDAMINEPPSAILNSTLTKVIGLSSPNKPRSLLVKHCLAFDPEGPLCHTETELPLNRSSVVILSDPVHAPSDPESNDIDVPGTVAAVLNSAKARKLFWVFLDHQMTAGPLEQALDLLREQHATEVVALNLDQALRLCAADGGRRSCFDRPAGAATAQDA